MSDGGKDRLNELERAIMTAEDAAEDARWAQSEEVCRRRDAGESLRAIAASWVNGRTGEPYSHTHVRVVELVWRRWGGKQLSTRPPFAEAYRAAQEGAEAGDEDKTGTEHEKAKVKDTGAAAAEDKARERRANPAKERLWAVLRQAGLPPTGPVSDIVYDMVERLSDEAAREVVDLERERRRP
jgi:hypothetical protein